MALTLCWMSFMPSAIYAECRKWAHYTECRYTECCYAECRYAECHYDKCRLSVVVMILNLTTLSIMAPTYAECHLCRVSFMLSVSNDPIMLSVIMLSVVMPNVVAPWTRLGAYHQSRAWQRLIKLYYTGYWIRCYKIFHSRNLQMGLIS